MYGPPGTGKTLFAKVKPCQDSANLRVAKCSENSRAWEASLVWNLLLECCINVVFLCLCREGRKGQPACFSSELVQPLGFQCWVQAEEKALPSGEGPWQLGLVGITAAATSYPPLLVLCPHLNRSFLLLTVPEQRQGWLHVQRHCQNDFYMDLSQNLIFFFLLILWCLSTRPEVSSTF